MFSEKMFCKFNSESVANAVSYLRREIIGKRLDSDAFVFQDTDPYIF
ncbi:MAG: hypothetical protein MUD00_01920 [Candidatus Pacebacteria bacterium]|jgi:hypothetical protein|nr:hypothetical protein [Candidatus Paceibacterota bacterium]